MILPIQIYVIAPRYLQTYTMKIHLRRIRFYSKMCYRVILIPEFLDLSQTLFTIEVTTLTKTPLEKENNIVLLHDAQEILKKEGHKAGYL
jgi:hypothetical protein